MRVARPGTADLQSQRFRRLRRKDHKFKVDLDSPAKLYLKGVWVYLSGRALPGCRALQLSSNIFLKEGCSHVYLFLFVLCEH